MKDIPLSVSLYLKPPKNMHVRIFITVEHVCVCMCVCVLVVGFNSQRKDLLIEKYKMKRQVVQNQSRLNQAFEDTYHMLESIISVIQCNFNYPRCCT